MDHQYHFGKKFYRDNKIGYWISTTEPRIRAHVFVWKYHFGPVPKGFHIHHIDENKSNNDISNLQLIDQSRHLKLHWDEEKRNLARKHAARIRPLTKEWHKSAQGREWHKIHGFKVWEEREPFPKVCRECSEEFITKIYHQEFCSNKCKSRARRKSGIDNIDYMCCVCGTMFKKSKYGRAITCGRTCGGIFKSKEYKRRRD